MKFIKKTSFALSTVIMVAFGAAPALASADCGKIPNLKAWGGITNARVEYYVDRKLNGDWQPYVDHLAKQLESVKGIQESGLSAKIRYKNQDIRLSGKRLDAYVKASEKRFEVVTCLAGLSEDLDATGLDEFATAAGSATDEAPVSEVKINNTRSPIQKASVSSSALRLNISTSCQDGNSIFKVTNRGAAWPKSSIFQIYRMDGEGKQIISSRRMRLKADQSSTFQIKASKNPTGQLGLFVDPAWYQRGFDYDATVRCR